MPHFYKLQIGKYIHLGVLGLFNMANWHFYLGSRSRRATPTSALHYHGDCLLTSVPLFTTGWGYFENGTAHRRYGWVFFIYCTPTSYLFYLEKTSSWILDTLGEGTKPHGTYYFSPVLGGSQSAFNGRQNNLGQPDKIYLTSVVAALENRNSQKNILES